MKYPLSNPVEQWAGNAAPTQSYATPDVERVLVLDGIASQISDTNANLAECLSRLRVIADNLLGGGLGNKTEQSNRPPAVGRLGGLAVIAGDTRGLVGEIRGEIERLSSL